MTASSILATGGNSVQATLGGLTFHDPWSDGMSTTEDVLKVPPLPSHEFALNGERIEVRTYVNEVAIHAGTVVSPAPTSQWENFTHATVRGVDVRRDYWVSVFPLAGHSPPVWDETNLCASAATSSVTSLPGPSRAGAPAFAADVGGAVSWTVTCEDPQATRHVKGDFVMSLWQWDAELESASGVHALPSGEEAQARDTVPGYPRVGITRDRQVYLTVTGGDLLLPAFMESQMFLFQPQLHVIGRTVLNGATGFLAIQGKDLNGDQVHLFGDLTVAMARQEGNVIPVQIGGRLTDTVSSAAALVHPPSSLAWLWLLSLPALAAVPMWLVWRRQVLVPQSATPQGRARAVDLFGHAETFAFEGGFRKARRLLDKAIRLDGLRPDLFALRARCLAMLGDTDAALRDHLHAHEAFPAGDPDAKASNAYEAARTCNQAGRRDEALSWLHLAAQYDPYILDDARDDPVLLSLFTSISGRPRRAER